MDGSRSGISRKGIITAALLTAAAAIAAAVIFVKVKDINIEGNSYYSDKEIIQSIFPDRISRCSALVFLKELTGSREKIAFIDDYKVTFRSPTAVDILVYEKSIIGYVTYMSSCMYLDKDGNVIESSSQPLPGIPLITGLRFGSISLYRRLPVEDERIFSDILNLTQILKSFAIEADRINYDDDRHATLYIGDVRVELGDSTDMNLKIAELRDMLPDIDGKNGTLYLDKFDKNDANPAYTFKVSRD